MSWTAQNLADLEAAIASGATSVRFGDRVVTYRSQSEMLELRSRMRIDLGLAATNQTHFAKFRKGPRPGQFPGAGRQRIS
jgi:collagenase-like PrtC family protease